MFNDFVVEFLVDCAKILTTHMFHWWVQLSMLADIVVTSRTRRTSHCLMSFCLLLCDPMSNAIVGASKPQIIDVDSNKEHVKKIARKIY